MWSWEGWMRRMFLHLRRSRDSPQSRLWPVRPARSQSTRETVPSQTSPPLSPWSSRTARQPERSWRKPAPPGRKSPRMSSEPLLAGACARVSWGSLSWLEGVACMRRVAVGHHCRHAEESGVWRRQGSQQHGTAYVSGPKGASLECKFKCGICACLNIFLGHCWRERKLLQPPTGFAEGLGDLNQASSWLV